MSGKIDQSLDQILKDRKRSHPRRSTRNAGRPGKSAAASTGGVTKGGRTTKAAPKKVAPPTGPSNAGPSKIIVSNLVSPFVTPKCHLHTLLTLSQPTDVTETQIKVRYTSGLRKGSFAPSAYDT